MATISDTPPARQSWKNEWAIMAGLALVLAAGAWWRSGTEPSAEGLLAEHLATLDPATIITPDSIQDNSAAPAAESPHEQARILFQNKQYKAALQAMKAVPAHRKNDAYFYELGVLYLLNRRPAKAVAALQRMENNCEGGKYWYLALSYHALGEQDYCREELFRALHAPGRAWRRKARRMLKALG
ncbi:MAG: hypothetical protein KDD10_27815 [Phaeodactylibacter sp.]|nr:hypothetical protein [Phaeodactylibacter sp.]MCB9292516.1 hypothetical protein [Lewinellaceae bacterium]